MSRHEVRVPDLGDFDSADVIEILVSPGDWVELDGPLITLETDKAAMDVPSPLAGTVVEVVAAAGTTVKTGDLIAMLELAEEAASDKPARTEQPAMPGGEVGAPGAQMAGAAAGAVEATGGADFGPRLLVLGAGPGGYTAAFRAADLGLDVTLVERWPTLGGVCLNVGCIPSKALLHAARVIEEAQEMSSRGIVFGAPNIDAARLVSWKGEIVHQLTQGLAGLARQRNVNIVRGYGRFASANSLEVDRGGESEIVEFDQCIIAVGSEPMRLPDVPDDPRVIDSTGALELDPLPKRLLVVGGGIIGLEMATVYEALGVRVSIVELTDTLIPGCDRDLVRPLQKRLEARCEAVMLGTRVAGMNAQASGIGVYFDGKSAPPEAQTYDRVLIAVGRRPNGARLAAERAGVEVDSRGFIEANRQMRTNVPHIFAIGDVVGQPMLAHKAAHEGRVAAEAAAGQKSFFDARIIPSVAYTDPEIAWVGLSEDEARAHGIDYDKGEFPWAASGRSLTLGRSEGMSKLIFDRNTGRVLGAGIVGTNAGDLIAEAALAIEMGADAEDIGLTIHPHPTLSETLAFAAEAAAGTITDLYLPKR